jgi:hypothetical protein
MLPIRSAKRIRPAMANAIEKITSPVYVLVWSPWPSVLQWNKLINCEYEFVTNFRTGDMVEHQT